jgi:hypothetical protein
MADSLKSFQLFTIVQQKHHCYNRHKQTFSYINLLLEIRTNVCYYNCIATGVLCGNRGVHNMDYKELIIKLLEKANKKQLQLLYRLIKAYIED